MGGTAEGKFLKVYDVQDLSREKPAGETQVKVKLKFISEATLDIRELSVLTLNRSFFFLSLRSFAWFLYIYIFLRFFYVE